MGEEERKAEMGNHIELDERKKNRLNNKIIIICNCYIISSERQKNINKMQFIAGRKDLTGQISVHAEGFFLFLR